MSVNDKDESLWSDDDTEGPPSPQESPGSVVQRLTWQNHELQKEITNLRQTITNLRARVVELEEIEAKRVQQDFKPAITMASAAPPTVGEIAVPASLFAKFVIASHGATQIFLKLKEGIVNEVVKK
jgi:hypothetical protein